MARPTTSTSIAAMLFASWIAAVAGSAAEASDAAQTVPRDSRRAPAAQAVAAAVNSWLKGTRALESAPQYGAFLGKWAVCHSVHRQLCGDLA